MELARASELHRRVKDGVLMKVASHYRRMRCGRCSSSWWQPVSRWRNGTARLSRRCFVARLKKRVCYWRRGRRRLRFVAQESRRRRARGCRLHLWHSYKSNLRCRRSSGNSGACHRRSTSSTGSNKDNFAARATTRSSSSNISERKLAWRFDL
uniref:Uncharacterized protein n=1 Tax=Trichogramma kaykai TaxID=54128 RepID=A0ABD2WPQ1_9HYME